MSKFIDAVEAKLTGTKVATPSALSITMETDTCYSIKECYVYRIGVEYSQLITCKP